MLLCGDKIHFNYDDVKLDFLGALGGPGIGERYSRFCAVSFSSFMARLGFRRLVAAVSSAATSLMRSISHRVQIGRLW